MNKNEQCQKLANLIIQDVYERNAEAMAEMMSKVLSGQPCAIKCSWNEEKQEVQMTVVETHIDSSLDDKS
jgi:hypothetical protein